MFFTGFLTTPGGGCMCDDAGGGGGDSGAGAEDMARCSALPLAAPDDDEAGCGGCGGGGIG